MKIIKFSMPGCQPCKLVDDYLTKKNVEFENIDGKDPKHSDLIIEYNVRKVPVTILLDSDNSIIEKVLGFNHLDLDHLINKFKGE